MNRHYLSSDIKPLPFFFSSGSFLTTFSYYSLLHNVILVMSPSDVPFRLNSSLHTQPSAPFLPGHTEPSLTELLLLAGHLGQG